MVPEMEIFCGKIEKRRGKMEKGAKADEVEKKAMGDDVEIALFMEKHAKNVYDTDLCRVVGDHLLDIKITSGEFVGRKAIRFEAIQHVTVDEQDGLKIKTSESMLAFTVRSKRRVKELYYRLLYYWNRAIDKPVETTREAAQMSARVGDLLSVMQTTDENGVVGLDE